MPILFLLLFVSSAAAQTDDLAARRARSWDVITQQRNQAMDALAQCIGEYTHQLEQVRKDLQVCQKDKSSPSTVPTAPQQ